MTSILLIRSIIFNELFFFFQFSFTKTMDLPIDRDTELIYVGGLPIETNNDDIGLIFSDVPIVRVFKLWKTGKYSLSTYILCEMFYFYV